MLIKRRCTATGVVNFFSKNEPYIAIGCVVARMGSDPFVWHYHGENRAISGMTRDRRTAEKAIELHHRRDEDKRLQERAAA